MKKIDLCGKWDVFNKKTGNFEGLVPGCVTTDLINAGKVYGEKTPAKYGKEDGIFYRDNAKRIQWIERENFTYTKKFEIPAEDGAALEKNATLVFECLDTYANITLNGIFLGRTDDMHIIQKFNVDGVVKTGENILSIEFLSPVKQTEDLPKRPAAFTAERLYSRREQCTYGWDWVYRFVTCGIERPCYLIFDNKMAVNNAYIYTLSADSETAQVNALVKIKNFEKTGYVTTTVVSPEGRIVYEKRRFVSEEYYLEYINLDDPKLWYPLGYGRQPLYKLRITVESEGQEPEVHEEKFGVRTVKIVQKKDVPGTKSYDFCLKLKDTASGKDYDQNEVFSSFTLYINERPILCRGGNWVPCDPFISDESDRKITRILSLAREGGFNMIRVWGGGVCEKDHFYSECDRLGILVTQDFLMACGQYPEEKEQFLKSLSEEAECAAIRLRNHPCLVWWSGDNENAVNGYEDLPKFNGREAALKAIGPVLRRLDYMRHFLPSSPYGGRMYASKTVGTTHNTQFLGYMLPFMLDGDGKKYKDFYKDYIARFIAEEPSFGAVNTTTLKEFMTDRDITGEDESMWVFHMQTNPGLPEQLYTYLRSYSQKVLGKFENGEDRLYKLRYLQCEWVRIGMEMVRRHMFFSSGIIYWMLNDCWPAAAGWAFVDYYCRTKDSFYAFKRCAGNIVASIDKEDGKYQIYLSSTSGRKEDYELKLYKIDYLTGKTLSTRELSASIGSDLAGKIYEFDEPLSDSEIYVLDVLDDDGLRYRTFYKDGALEMRKNCCAYIVDKTKKTLTVKADGFVQSVFLDGDYVFDDNCFMMLPGETKTVSFKENVCFGRDVKCDPGEIGITTYGLV